MSRQKFFMGDVVKVADDLGPSMRHFTAGCEAIVIGSYADQYGFCEDRNLHVYSLVLLPSKNEASWYHEHQLTFLRRITPAALAELRHGTGEQP